MTKLKLQPNSWTCGPAAMRNALSTMTGVKRAPSIARIARLGKATPSKGCSPAMMQRAAKALGYDLRAEDREFWFGAQACVRSALARGDRVIVVLDRDKDGPWAHWIAVHKANSRHVWIADSANPPPVQQRMTWRAFLARACTVIGPSEQMFGLYVLAPRAKELGL